jgi:hypothetical protein
VVAEGVSGGHSFVVTDVHKRPSLESQVSHQSHHRIFAFRNIHRVSIASGALSLGRESESARGVSVAELHLSVEAAMVGIQQAAILNHLHEIHDLPREGRAVFVGIDRHVDDLVHSKGGGRETANDARTRAVKRVIGHSRWGVLVREIVSEPSVLRGAVSRGPAIAILIVESHQ